MTTTVDATKTGASSAYDATAVAITGGTINATPIGGTTPAAGAFTTVSLGSGNTLLFGDAANTFAQRNGTAAQTFNLYNTYTDAGNYERVVFSWSSNILSIGTSAGGTGTQRPLTLTCGGNMQLSASGSVFISGSVAFNSDNTNDIGAVGNSPRSIRAATSVVAPILKNNVLTVATLTAAATAGAGAYSFVSDASVVAAGNFGSIVAGGGANGVPVYGDGTNWRIG